MEDPRGIVDSPEKISWDDLKAFRAANPDCECLYVLVGKLREGGYYHRASVRPCRKHGEESGSTESIDDQMRKDKAFWDFVDRATAVPDSGMRAEPPGQEKSPDQEADKWIASARFPGDLFLEPAFRSASYTSVNGRSVFLRDHPGCTCVYGEYKGGLILRSREGCPVCDGRRPEVTELEKPDSKGLDSEMSEIRPDKEPDRNIAIRIAREWHETWERIEREDGPRSFFRPWDDLDILLRVRAANVVADLISRGIIVPGDKDDG